MKRRKSLLVSDEVQHSLLIRVTIHWVLFLAANLFALGIWICCIELPVATRAEQLEGFTRLAVPLLICSLTIVPVFLYDITKLSNQFAGPIRRISNALKSFLEQGKYEPINLRRNDFWQRLANDCNAVMERNTSAPIHADGKYPEA